MCNLKNNNSTRNKKVILSSLQSNKRKLRKEKCGHFEKKMKEKVVLWV